MRKLLTLILALSFLPICAPSIKADTSIEYSTEVKKSKSSKPKTQKVKSYKKKNGTKVKSYKRSKPRK